MWRLSSVMADGVCHCQAWASPCQEESWFAENLSAIFSILSLHTFCSTSSNVIYVCVWRLFYSLLFGRCTNLKTEWGFFVVYICSAIEPGPAFLVLTNPALCEYLYLGAKSSERGVEKQRESIHCVRFSRRSASNMRSSMANTHICFTAVCRRSWFRRNTQMTFWFSEKARKSFCVISTIELCLFLTFACSPLWQH